MLCADLPRAKAPVSKSYTTLGCHRPCDQSKLTRNQIQTQAEKHAHRDVSHMASLSLHITRQHFWCGGYVLEWEVYTHKHTHTHRVRKGDKNGIWFHEFSFGEPHFGQGHCVVELRERSDSERVTTTCTCVCVVCFVVDLPALLWVIMFDRRVSCRLIVAAVVRLSVFPVPLNCHRHVTHVSPGSARRPCGKLIAYQMQTMASLPSAC